MHVSRTLVVGVICLAGVSSANETTSTPATPPTTITAPARPAVVPRTEASAPIDEPPAPTAPEPVDPRLFFDAMLGLGSEQLNLGIGARGGKTFDNHLYLGGLFVYHLGTSATTTVGTTMETSSVSGFYIGPEVGYDIPVLTSVVLRPYLGIGLADASASSSGSGSASASSSELSIWPGIAAHYQLSGSKYVVGGDLRIVTGPWGTSLGLFVLGGTHFGS